MAEAHHAGLVVHAWTVRDEHDPDLAAKLLGLGVDGIFTDQPDTAVVARARAATISRLVEPVETTVSTSETFCPSLSGSRRTRFPGATRLLQS